MKEKTKNITQVVLIGALLFGFFLWCILKPTTATSDAERRPLATLPSLSAETLSSGIFMEKFEDYAADQFPLRDSFRTLKLETALYLFRQSDKSGLYLQNGFLARMDYTMNEASVDYAAQKFQSIYDMYLSSEDVRVFLSVIPDKNEYMDTLKLDYAALTSRLSGKMPFASLVDLRDALTLEDYYRTDSHWRQEKLLPAARKLAAAMGVTLKADYEVKTADAPFRGVYYGQSALPLPAETLNYLTGPVLDACTVFDYETGKSIPIYNQEAAAGKDPYGLFLSGSKSLLKLTNPNAETTRRLIVFRDSFGSSVAPLLAEGYSEITLVDIRYLPSARLQPFVDFTNADVLFLYSTTVLNNSETLK